MCRESWGPQKRQYRADAWSHFGLVWGKVWSREQDRRSDSERLQAETKDASKVELCSSFIVLRPGSLESGSTNS